MNKSLSRFYISASIILIPFLQSAKASEIKDQEILNFIHDFNQNPSKVMNKIPDKKTIKGSYPDVNPFSQDEINNKDYVLEKDLLRKEIIAKSSQSQIHPNQEYLPNDNARDLVDNPSLFIDRISQIDAKKLRTASLPFQPWSDTYWPMYLGNIAFRYSDPNMPTSETFSDNYMYLLQHNANELIAQGRIDELSPSEKYDLLMNDRSFSLTNAILNDINSKGQPERWEGICHGWAPASYMYQRPVRTVSVYNSSGTKINFFPSDIKALSSTLWTMGASNVKFVGGRCTDKEPPTDRNGRILSQDCFDSNPATVHLALVNRVGLNQNGFVFDATYDYQVWNQPVLSYSFIYFNPQTGVASDNSKNVTIPLSSYTNDYFKTYRSSKAVSVVGVKLKLNYIVETAPTADRTNDPSQDGIKSVVYYYDLELGADGQIIGGEWYQNAHPDFIWTPASSADVNLNAVPYYPNQRWSYMYENYIWTDTPRSPAPEWSYYAQAVSSKYRLPLDHVVKNLSAWSSVEDGKTPELCKQQPCVPSPYRWHN